MERKFLLLILPTLLCTSQVQALSQLVSWQATAKKSSESSVILLHSGQQLVSTSSSAGQVLAARFSAPSSGITLQARALSSTTSPLSVTLNGKTLTGNYQSLPVTKHYYLSYHQISHLDDKITESGYELITYWQP